MMICATGAPLRKSSGAKQKQGLSRQKGAVCATGAPLGNAGLGGFGEFAPLDFVKSLKRFLPPVAHLSTTIVKKLEIGVPPSLAAVAKATLPCFLTLTLSAWQSKLLLGGKEGTQAARIFKNGETECTI